MKNWALSSYFLFALACILFVSAVFTDGLISFIFFLLFCAALWKAITIAKLRKTPADSQIKQAPRKLLFVEWPPAIKHIMDIEEAIEHDDVLLFEGRLRVPSSSAIAYLNSKFPDNTVFLTHGNHFEHLIEIIPFIVDPSPSRISLLQVGLLCATIISVTAMGARYYGINITQEPLRIREVLPYSLSIIFMMGVHEGGHYFAARHHNINVTAPYFIPNFFGLGTWGAAIMVKSPPANRRNLFDMAVAGPLAGLAGALLFACAASCVPLKPIHHPLISSFCKDLDKTLLGQIIALVGGVPHLTGWVDHPFAVAAIFCLLLTIINLLPIGQLDGGKMLLSLVGIKKFYATEIIVYLVSLGLSLSFNPWLVGIIIISLFLPQTRMLILDDLEELDPKRRLLGYGVFGFLLLAIIPVL